MVIYELREPAVEHIYIRMPYGASGDYAALWRIARAARATPRAPIAVAHLVGLPLALAPWLRARGARVVAHVTLAQQAYRGPAKRLRAALGWRCFDRWVDVYACSAEHVRRQLAAQGYPAAKLRVVPPPLDTGRFAPGDRAAARRRLDLPGDAFLVVYVDTLSPPRFPAAQVVQALHLAATDIPDLRLAVFAPAGTQPYNTGWAEGHVCHAGAGSTLPITVRLGDLDDEQKAALYRAADVVLLPFAAPVATEPPLTLLEAMACEALVAVAPHANCSQLVADFANGVTFDGPEELAARLKALYALDAPRRAALRAAARAVVVERHGFAAVARVVEELWATLEHKELLRDEVTR